MPCLSKGRLPLIAWAIALVCGTVQATEITDADPCAASPGVCVASLEARAVATCTQGGYGEVLEACHADARACCTGVGISDFGRLHSAAEQGNCPGNQG